MLIDISRPILAVDTGTSFLSLALRADGEVRLYHENVGTRQSELILPQICVLFEQAGIGASDLGGIVYAQGPGAFTGLRIGAGVVQGLATPFDTPVIGVPSLDAFGRLSCRQGFGNRFAARTNLRSGCGQRLCLG